MATIRLGDQIESRSRCRSPSGSALTGSTRSGWSHEWKRGLTAALEALVADADDVLIPAAISSGVLLAVNVLRRRYVVLFDARVRREGQMRRG